MLDQASISSKELMESYLIHIEAHNRQGMNLRAILDLAPKTEIVRLAEELDAEHERGEPRGPFHGIPIVVKVYDLELSCMERLIWVK